MSLPILDFLQSNGWRVPLLLVYVVGMVLAAVTWRRHPLASALSLVGFLLLGSLASAVFSWLALSQSSTPNRGTLFGMGTLAYTVLSVVGWVLILIALFARRPQPTHTPRFKEPRLLEEARPAGDQPPDTGIQSPR